ncbi:hypothetical protein HF086_011764 [Spodoptera exigua]|uniref:Uncharacterized protein n=1 Tax=Spodoptera exigua TaxID=7107 RepID=A0A922MI36_SPOEX|nr:hypothetical protein HF086_011764 [Spodoptera exigua]
MVEDTTPQQERVSAAAVLQFAAREAREGRRFTEFGAHAFASITYNAYASALSDMGGSGTSSSSSHMSPGWQVNDLDLELPGELSMNKNFSFEIAYKSSYYLLQITSMVVDNNRDAMEEGSCQQSPTHNGNMMVQHGSPESMQCQPTIAAGTLMPMNGYHSPSAQENKNAGLLMCSPVGSLDGFLHSPIQTRSEPSFKDDTR